MNPADIGTIRDNLIAEVLAETARRLKLVQAGNPPPTSYSVGGKSVSWNEYLRAVREEIKGWIELANAAGADGGLTEEYIRAYS